MLEVRLFGQPQIKIDSQPVKWAAPPKTLPLLAYLLLHRGQMLERQQIAFLFWPDCPEDVARANLRRHLHYLQRHLPPAAEGCPWLISEGQRIGWNWAADLWLDVAEFERLSAERETWEKAAAVYAGDFLETVYEDWVLLEQERLRGIYLDTLTHLLFEYRAQRNFARAMSCAQQILTSDPYREDVFRQLLATRYEAGDRSGALREYELFVQRLREDMGIPPMPETQALYEVILRQARISSDFFSLPQLASAAGDFAGNEKPNESPFLPFVGREVEFRHLVECWNSATRGQGSLTLVGGEAGIGKSRLLRELALWAEREGGRVLIGQVQPVEVRPYQPLIEAFESILPLITALDPEKARLPVLVSLIPEIGRRCALEPLPILDPQREQKRLFEAVACCLAQLSAPRPLLLAFEDLHWAGEATLALLDYLAHSVVNLPIFLLGTYREEETHRAHPLRKTRRRLQEAGLVHPLALRRLNTEAVDNLVRRINHDGFLDHPLNAEVSNRLYPESEGNPLFLEMILRGLQQGKTLLAGELPGGIGTIILKRIQGLPPPVRSYAETAAVVGTAFDAEVVREVCGWDEAEAYEVLGYLLDHHLVREVGNRGQYDFAFSHHLIQVALDADIGASKRKRKHLRVAEVLEDLFPEQKAERAGELAYHFDLGGECLRAARYDLLAGQQWLAVYADAEALAAINRGLALSENLPPETGDALRFDLLLLREDIFKRGGKPQEQKADLKRLKVLAGLLGDGERICQATLRQLLFERNAGQREDEQATLALLSESARGSAHWEAEAVLQAGISQKSLNNHTEALRLFYQALEQWERIGETRRQMECCLQMNEVLVNLRELAEAQKWMQKALALGASQPPSHLLLRTLWSMAANAFSQRDWAACVEHGRLLLGAAEQASDTFWMANARRIIGQAYVGQFRVQEAEEQYQIALSMTRVMELPKVYSLICESLGLLAVKVGRLEAGIKYHQQSLKIAQELKTVNNQAIDWINLAQAYALQGAWTEAKDAAQEGLSCAQECQNLYLEAHARHALGEALRDLGEQTDALQNLALAREIFLSKAHMVDGLNVSADLALTYWKAGLREQAREWALRVASEVPLMAEKMEAPQRQAWAAGVVLEAVGENQQAETIFKLADQILQKRLAALEGTGWSEAYRQLPFNRGILERFSF